MIRIKVISEREADIEIYVDDICFAISNINMNDNGYIAVTYYPEQSKIKTTAINMDGELKTAIAEIIEQILVFANYHVEKKLGIEKANQFKESLRNFLKIKEADIPYESKEYE